MGATILIPVTLTPRTDHHKDLHPAVAVTHDIIYDDGTDPVFDVRNDTDQPTLVLFCWRLAGGPVPAPYGHQHGPNHQHGAGAAAPNPQEHGAQATAAYDHVVCADCMGAEGLDFYWKKVAAREQVQIPLPRKAMEPRRGVRPDGSQRELRQIYLGTLYQNRENDLHKGRPRPTDKQVSWLYFIEHPFTDPPHPNHEHRHHSEEVILGN